jgi:hypothetical protein
MSGYLPSYLPPSLSPCRRKRKLSALLLLQMAAVVMFLECWKLEVAEKVLFFD